MAEAGQAVVATPFTLAGAMTPVTLAAAIAQQNAEALFCVALTQIVRPGAPVVYGAFTSNVDMRTGSPAFGTPEYVKGAIASGQMARRYRLPWRSSNATASAVVDAQAAYESEMAVWGAVMGGVNLLYQGAGWLEGGLDGVVREADRRRRDPPDDVRGAPAGRGRRGVAGPRRDRRGRARAATSSAPPTRWSDSRPRSTGRSSRTGGTTRPGPTMAQRPPPSERTAIWKQLLAEFGAAAPRPRPRRSASRRSSRAGNARSWARHEREPRWRTSTIGRSATCWNGSRVLRREPRPTLRRSAMELSARPPEPPRRVPDRAPGVGAGPADPRAGQLPRLTCPPAGRSTTAPFPASDGVVDQPRSSRRDAPRRLAGRSR